MTKDEAIKSLNNIIEYWAYRPTEVEAAKMAIEALKNEDTTTARWIRTKIYGSHHELIIQCSACGDQIEELKSASVLKYCPTCGRKMV